MKKLTKEEAFERIADYILDGDKEKDDYIDWCETHGYDPKKIHGLNQAGHVYAQALIAYELEFQE